MWAAVYYSFIIIHFNFVPFEDIRRITNDIHEYGCRYYYIHIHAYNKIKYT